MWFWLEFRGDRLGVERGFASESVFLKFPCYFWKFNSMNLKTKLKTITA